MSALQLLFLGTGTSTGLPLTPCLTLSHPYPEAFTSHVPPPNPPPKGTRAPPGYYDPEGPWPQNVTCACCRSAVDKSIREGWKNNRGNTSAIIRKKDKQGKWRNILVDCGKSFVQQARRFFPQWGVQTIDAVLLTHGHADAYFGLDDLREWCIRQKRSIPIYLDQPTYDIVAVSFPYLVDAAKASGGGDIPQLTWNIISDDASFSIFDIDIDVYPVHHGVYFQPPTTVESSKTGTASLPPNPDAKPGEPHPLICLSFAFDRSILYISDVSEIPARTWERLRGDGIIFDQHASRKIPDISTLSTEAAPHPLATEADRDLLTNGDSHSGRQLPILVIDALWPLRTHMSHFSLAQALEAALRIRPELTYLIGSTHPTTHFMWEEICLDLSRGRSSTFTGESDSWREAHPDHNAAIDLKNRVRGHQNFAGSKGEDGLRQLWRQGDGIVEPAWDGLAVELDYVRHDRKARRKVLDDLSEAASHYAIS